MCYGFLNDVKNFYNYIYIIIKINYIQNSYFYGITYIGNKQIIKRSVFIEKVF